MVWSCLKQDPELKILRGKKKSKRSEKYEMQLKPNQFFSF